MVPETFRLDLLRREGMQRARKAIQKWPWPMADRLANATDILNNDLYGSIDDLLGEEMGDGVRA